MNVAALHEARRAPRAVRRYDLADLRRELFGRERAPGISTEPRNTRPPKGYLDIPDSPDVPPTIPGMVLWLRSDRGISLNGGNVSAWADQSGQGNHFNQGSAPNQPPYNAAAAVLNGRPSIGPFRSTAQFLNYAGGSTYNTWQMFAVTSTPASAPSNYYLFGNDTLNRGDIYAAGGNFRALFSAASTDIAGGSDAAGAHVISVEHPTADGSALSRIYVDSKTEAVFHPVQASTDVLFAGGAGNACIASYAGDKVSGTYNWHGEVAEFIVYNRILSAPERSRVLDYIAARYAITVAP